MRKEDIDLLYKIQKQSILFKDILGTHKGIIYELKVLDKGIYAYGLFFGQNVWFKLNENTFEWEEIK